METIAKGLKKGMRLLVCLARSGFVHPVMLGIGIRIVLCSGKRVDSIVGSNVEGGFMQSLGETALKNADFECSDWSLQKMGFQGGHEGCWASSTPIILLEGQVPY